METWSAHQLYNDAKHRFKDIEKASSLRSYAQFLIDKNLPVIFSLKHLAKINDLNYSFLRLTVERRRESSNYRMYAVKKRAGGRRFIHSVTKKLLKVQTFINTEILQYCLPHPSSFAFHPSGGIRRCAEQHCSARWMFQFDILNFFHAINEVEVFNIFTGLGYRPLVAFEMARICTTTHVPNHLKPLLFRKSNNTPYNFYANKSGAIGVLPQGAPTSPMLANLVAKKLDEELSSFVRKHGFTYTRYADDITISAVDLPDNLSIGEIHRSVISIIRRCKFRENIKKTRVAGPGSKKLVLGLLVDGDKPRISREMYKRIDRNLHALEKYPIADVAKYEGFDSSFGFFNHVSGLVAFTKDVDTERWEKFKKRIDGIELPWESKLVT
ncbi:reverse transcriptase family protein [Leucothrix arctica]|uniref:RNA-directed DNA polymerase n=1 Tax=Leucothrix arctica TaxID=1481894 RepID=A0A317CER9_9GAMM|nr:reverse transcriptase family protein [Leucothrix arctica]PWQ97078.1 RNA-directed DNA polymerase [Leucothrix arctica]